MRISEDKFLELIDAITYLEFYWYQALYHQLDVQQFQTDIHFFIDQDLYSEFITLKQGLLSSKYSLSPSEYRVLKKYASLSDKLKAQLPNPTIVPNLSGSIVPKQK